MQINYSSVQELAQALRDAEAAHGRHEAETGQPDPDWPAWYADHMARTQAKSTRTGDGSESAPK